MDDEMDVDIDVPTADELCWPLKWKFIDWSNGDGLFPLAPYDAKSFVVVIDVCPAMGSSDIVEVPPCGSVPLDADCCWSKEFILTIGPPSSPMLGSSRDFTFLLPPPPPPFPLRPQSLILICDLDFRRLASSRLLPFFLRGFFFLVFFCSSWSTSYPPLLPLLDLLLNMS